MSIDPELVYSTPTELFEMYMCGEEAFSAANYSEEEKISLFRAVPYEDISASSSYIEILDYEKASALIEKFDSFSIGFCSCRHKKTHLGEKECDALMESCSSFGVAAEYIRLKTNSQKEYPKHRCRKISSDPKS